MDLTPFRGAVVVGLDESGAARLALDRGLDLARRQHRRLVVLNVAELGTRAYANRLVRRGVARVRHQDPTIDVQGIVLVGEHEMQGVLLAAGAVLVPDSRVRRPSSEGPWTLPRYGTGFETGATRGRDLRCGTTPTATTTTA